MVVEPVPPVVEVELVPPDVEEESVPPVVEELLEVVLELAGAEISLLALPQAASIKTARITDCFK